jgi:fatty acid desaturase
MKRDLTGQTGSRFLLGSLKGVNNIVMRGGTNQEVDDNTERAPSNSLNRGLFTNAVLLLILASLGVAWLYLLWIIAYVVTYPTLSRIRQVAEHGNVPDLFDLDPRQNTRTTIPNPLERLVLCPNNVNYHLEHHLLASVPCYRLKAFHQRLKKNGFYDGHEHLVAHGYWDVLKRAVPELGGAPSPA